MNSFRILAGLVVAMAGVVAAPAAPDRAYPGTVRLSVDATDLAHRVFHIRESIPVAPGSLVLYYPKWIPGHHAPTGPIDSLAGLQLSAGGHRVEWRRDPSNVYAFNVEVPAGATQLDAEFDLLSPAEPGRGRVVMTDAMVSVQWTDLLIYPAGYAVSRIPFAAELTLPAGWKLATALGDGTPAGAAVRFAPVSLEVLMDSPVLAGRNFARLDLDPGSPVPVSLDVFADTPDELAATPAQVEAHRRLVREARQLFGARHFDHYDFLFSISDDLGGVGLEHQRSSEDSARPGFFREWDKAEDARVVMSHELVHSWNGKFRRPADLYTPDYNTPMQDSLLWVYEGMTEYYGVVLAARSGLWTPETARGFFAFHGAQLDEERAGRSWRPLQDTTNQPVINRRTAQAFVSWQRTEDYYREGAFIWLDADTKIRELTGGKRSLDDFARAFFGVEDGRWSPLTYTFEDVVRTLNGVVAHDWAAFLRTRLDGHGPGAPLDGVARGGWRLEYKDEPMPYQKQRDEHDKSSNYSHSLGLVLDAAGKITNVVWGSPAFTAGLTPACTVVAVNGRAYKAERLKQAVRAAHDGGPIELLVRDLDSYRTVPVKYASGLRQPVLVRAEGTPDRLDDILRPRLPVETAPVKK